MIGPVKNIGPVFGADAASGGMKFALEFSSKKLIFSEKWDTLNWLQGYVRLTDDGYFRYDNSSGRGKGGSVICFENITSELW
jgi:hypothetical protein